MIIDKRIQRKKITIEFLKKRYDYDLDKLVDKIIKDLKIIINQRKISKDVKIQVSIE